MPSSVLQRPTLVLNRNWQPVHVSTVARTLIMLYAGTVRAIDPDDYQAYDWDDWSKLRPREDEKSIQSVSFRLRVPEVVALAEYDAMPTVAVSFSRRNVFKRDRYTCQYCNRQPGEEELTIDHVVPRSQGGVSSWENCVLACITCNGRKGCRSVEQAGLKLRRKPVRPTWRPLYAHTNVRIASWSKFLSEAYWNAELEE